MVQRNGATDTRTSPGVRGDVVATSRHARGTAWSDRDPRTPTPLPRRGSGDGIGNAERRFVRAWANAYRFGPYRDYPWISSADSERLLIDSALDCGPDVTHRWRRDATGPVGMLRIVELPWDTELYGRRMGRITHLCGDLDGAAIRELLAGSGYEHLAVRIDASDVAMQAAVAGAGFVPADSMATYLYDPERGELPHSPPRRATRNYLYRPYQPADREAVLRITAHCYARYPGRYHSDPQLRDKGPQRYLHWAERCVQGYADQICVAESQGRVVGYIAFRYDRRLQRLLGLGCYGGAALGASRGGDYQSLLRYTLTCPKAIPMQFAECQTQFDNYHVHRVYHGLGLQYVRAEHTFHWHRG